MAATHSSCRIARRRYANRTESVRISVYFLQAVLDFGAVALGFLFADLIRFGELQPEGGRAFYFFVVPVFMMVNFYARAYSYEALMSFATATGRLVSALSITLAISLLVFFAVKDISEISRIVFFIGAGISAFLLLLVRLPITWLVKAMGSRFMRRVLIVDGVHVSAPSAFEIVDAGAMGIRPDLNDPFMLHRFSTLVVGADRVVVSCKVEDRARWALYLKGCGCWGELLVPELHGVAPVHNEPHLGIIGIRVSTGPLDLSNRILKRSLDLIVAVSAILLVAPLLAVIALAVKLDSPGPVLFRQTRMGQGNRLFHVYKFRSMRNDLADQDGARSVTRHDDRITRVGRILRATSIDELPQLFNVMAGDMSLVGPRPHALGSLAGEQLFWHVDNRYWLRHAIKPGITGLAQVRGFRGATDSKADLSNRLQSDLEYVSNWSIVKDFTILLRTFMVVIHTKAY